MKKNIFYILSALLFILFSPLKMDAQKKVKGKPQEFNRPVDYFDDENTYKAYLRKTSPKSNDNGWLVFSDRNGNNVYDKPNGGIVRQIQFRDNFFVVDEKDDWIKIATARVDALKIVKGSKEDVGWVPKENMLLWNSGIIGRVTRIHKKILLLNRADQIDKILLKKNKESVIIYSGPDKAEREADRRIFEYFFLLKKENGMYLIAEEAIVNPYAPEKIIGWVDARDCDVWDTRICLEPNFTDYAYNERAAKKDLMIRAYESSQSAQEALKGSSKESNVFWKNDPVILQSDEKSKTDHKRFLGSVIRFPMVSITGSGGEEVYKSGIVGTVKLKSENGKLTRDIDENKLAQLEKQLKVLESKATKVNIFYVIEGTDHSFPFKQTIIQSMKGVHDDLAKKKLVKVNYGALIYRDTPEESVAISGEEVNRMTEHTPLNPDIDKLINFVQNSEFKNKVDRDDYTAMYYGINRALLKGGFKANTSDESELNIIILMGNYGDFRADRDRRKAAQGHPALFNPDKLETLVANLNGIDAHLYTMQLKNDGYKPAVGFAKAGQYLMLENAKMIYNKQQRKINTKIKGQLDEYGYKNYNQGPSLELSDSEEVSVMDNGAIPGSLTRPASTTISNASLSNQIRNNVNNSIDHVVNLKKAISFIVSQGGVGGKESVERVLEIDPKDAGPFEAGLTNVLIQMLESNPDVDIPDILDEKYKLFTEVYIPYKYPEATHPLVSYVLFMPESDLIDYVRNIERCQALFLETSYDKKREGLFKVYKSLLDQFTGEGASMKKSEDEVTIGDVQRMMNGVYTSGLRLDPDKELKLVEILSEKIPNEKIDQLIERFTDVEKKLSGILRDADTYDFCYKTDDFNRYYWVPIEETF